MRTGIKIGIISVALLGVLAGLFLRRFEGSYIIETPSRVYDFIGFMRNAYNQATRHCGSVSRLQPASPKWRAVTDRIARLEKVSIPMPRQIMQLDTYFLAESDFEANEPAIFLLQETTSEITILATWGGSAAPFREEPAIRDYFFKTTPQAPRMLIECFDPKGPPFDPS